MLMFIYIFDYVIYTRAQHLHVKYKVVGEKSLERVQSLLCQCLRQSKLPYFP